MRRGAPAARDVSYTTRLSPSSTIVAGCTHRSRRLRTRLPECVPTLAAEQTTIVVGRAPNRGQPESSGLATPFTKAASGCRISRNRTAKFILGHKGILPLHPSLFIMHLSSYGQVTSMRFKNILYYEDSVVCTLTEHFSRLESPGKRFQAILIAVKSFCLP